MAAGHYDIIIIGTGAGGGTLVNKLAPSGKKILVLERGNFLPQEKANWDTKQVWQKEHYRNSETWYDKNGKPIQPVTHYYVGGNTKFYGGALFRLREQDFEGVIHKGGISPEWSLKYQDFAPYYDQAEKLYEVHGKRGLDPTEPKTTQDYPFPPVSHEIYTEEINEALKDKGFHPFYLPLGIKLNEANRLKSDCIRCDTCDGFPCFLNAKADADINGVRPALAYPNITLITKAKVLRLHTSASGREVTKVEVDIAGKSQIFSGDIVVVACGAINSAVLLLQSANDQHPNGLANSSDLVGRNYMAHKYAAIITLSAKSNPTVFQKTLAINDFYWGEKDFPFPMGSIQLLGNISKDKVSAHAPFFLPSIISETVANHSIPWLLITEDLPDPDNRVRLKGGKVFLEYTNNNEEAYNRLIERWNDVLKSIKTSFGNCSLNITTKMSLREVAHQCGTCRFGEDPKTSVLDINCRTHDVDNLYVVDSSFFPSSAAVNPSLTIMANALRVGEHLLKRLG
ncbi:GMC family oxidoreductase [Aetokthonos hydrillicola Thurmond2011]|jgi:choline dehydrogenase-like flavoprotein|uniref:GMC family oxidoreductase n=1 Tax=Aetokthonos hydrillicola Thurmond2011 TaxID=2712845 RepID=A0AAP5M6V1_9CYAN|nr:GMC family oxidoreductase [Aetokthonos hydrillicola]MBO3464076.1 GMC family oxidoreductase [Aetokthonos hydrillicola CCALA 1050]MBW4586283.1 GMC family oxidoreductase [Aetokthonos hydrillicola CCALA 1050]MDR9897411.1 GMC family oxidoreductase [Aetokthonos hydrillicola Thurmond2011]